MKERLFSIWNWSWGLFKKYPVILIFLFLGIAFWLIQYKIQRQVGHIVPWATTLFKLLAYFFLLVSPYLLLLKKKQYIFANVLIIGPILILFELICFVLISMPDKAVIDFSIPDNEESALQLDLGNAPEPLDTIYDKKEEVFEVNYHIDNYSRRITPDFDSARSEYALFFGCSIAFGYGLNDNETMAYYYQNQANCNSKNYGFNGYGTNHMLARLQHNNLSEEVEEKEGVAYYLFFWDHIKRAIGTMDRYNEWVALAPYYYFEGENLMRNKSFRAGRYWTSRFYEFAYQTSIAQYFEIDFPNELRGDHYELIAAIVEESKNEYESQFGNDEFYLVFYPNWKDYEEKQLDEFKTYLDKREIEYIDLNTFMEYKDENSLGGDPHPNAETNKVLAAELFNRYQKLKD